MGVEPGKPEAHARASPAQTREGGGVGGAVAPEDEEPGMLAALEQRDTEVRGEARQIVEQRTAVLRSSIVVGSPARVVGGVAMIEPRDPAQPGPRGEPSHEARLAQQGRRPFHATEVAAECCRGPGDDDRVRGAEGRHAPQHIGRDQRDRVRHHGPMRIAEFALERFFARWEFAVEHLLCASDLEGYPMRELLDLADDEARGLWDRLTLGYTESTGHPLLKREIAVAV